MNLYLVRHGEAKSESEDSARPLNRRGREEIARLATHLARTGVRVAEIQHSPKARASETAAILSAALKTRAVLGKGLLPEDDPTPIAAAVSVEKQDLMIVGHLPHLARVAGLLLVGNDTRPPFDLRTGSLMRLEKEGKRWRLLWALSPDALP